MNFIYKFFARLTHPYNRPELAGNITVLFLAFLYLFISIITTQSGKVQLKETYKSSSNKGIMMIKF